ncbi:hypothetical protein BH11PLA2_BH11PLA2_47140 [soil metagenome]
MLRWGQSNRHCKAEPVAEAILVRNVRKGEHGVAPAKQVYAVDEEHVNAIMPHLTPTLRSMVQLQRATGMRPGEVFRLRPADILTTGRRMVAGIGPINVEKSNAEIGSQLWWITYDHHKTDGDGMGRAWAIDMRVAEILKPFMDRPPTENCFNPAESVQQASETVKRERIELRGGGSGGSRKLKTGRRSRPMYTRQTFRRAIGRACDKAGVPRFNLYQVRYLVSVEALEEGGVQLEMDMLGHKTSRMAKHYARQGLMRMAKSVAQRARMGVAAEGEVLPLDQRNKIGIDSLA